MPSESTRTPDPRACVLALLLGLTLLSAGTTAAEDAPPATSVTVLCIGNYAADWWLEFATAAGVGLDLSFANAGSARLQTHWGHVARHEEDAAAGRVYGDRSGTKRSLKEVLLSKPFDYVIIQQFSSESADPASYVPYARNLRDYIARHAPQAELLVHETWAYGEQGVGLAKLKLSQDEMYTRVRAAYDGVAKDLGCRVIPVGDAFQMARGKPVPGFTPDPAATVIEPTKSDGRHPSGAGHYLLAAVFTEVLCGVDVREVSFTRGLEEGQAAELRAIAHQAVALRQAEGVTD